tara:strand:- start:362 stop:943 length:582 start_codon:yes stop_codon:yes gene_type:complete
MLTLVVNERLDEAMTLRQRIAAGLIAAGAAGGLGTQMSKIGGSTPPPATLTRSIGGQETEKVPTNTTLAQPKAKARAITSVKPEDTGPESGAGRRGENLNQQYNRLLQRRADQEAFDKGRGATPYNRKPLVPPYRDSHGDWQAGPKPDNPKSHYGFPGLPKDALDRDNETPEERQERLHREGKVKNSYLPKKN